jgi:hypothetical protein
MTIIIVLFYVLGNGQDKMVASVSKAVNSNILFNQFGTCFLSLYMYIAGNAGFT